MTQAPTTPTGSDPLTARLLHQRIVPLGQELDDATAHRLCVELLLLSAEDPHAGISLYLRSPGGSTSAGLAVYDTMRLIPNEVSTLAIGEVAGPGLLLLAAGTPGRRHALPHARVVASPGPDDVLDDDVASLLVGCTGQSREAVAQDAHRWLSAAQARERGIVDELDVVGAARERRTAGLGVTGR